MHELSIALSLLELVEEEAQRRGGARVEAVHLKLGGISGVVKEALTSAYEMAREGTELAGCRLVIEEVQVRIRCPSCEAEREVVSPQEIRCAVCGTATADIVSGRELEVVALEIAE
jgi:hydrogenase nickel incorporation protein HypA/HybF